jgi:outer membrane protein assembly factor BamB
VALDADTGEEIWRTQIETETGVQMTGSPTLWDGVLLVPISTGNEAFATNDNYECCRFIGSLVALDARDGTILWKTYTTSQKNMPYRLNAKGQQMWGPSGGSIWSAPTIDPKRNLQLAHGCAARRLQLRDRDGAAHRKSRVEEPGLGRRQLHHRLSARGKLPGRAGA